MKPKAMSYLVLARKYRPQTFEEVVGQKPITQALQNAIETQRVAHAYLFAGPRGVGKTSVARILAKALNCAKGPTGYPCNQCPACLEIRDGNSMDVMEIDGASNRGIDEIRQLRENVKYLPAQNPYKVYIIDEVHMLTEPAFNALLKTLEEPPAHVIFILATTEPHKIPLTILSRCQRYNFKRIPLESMVGHLQKIAQAEKVEISEGSLYLIARQAQGSLRDAQSLLDQVLSFSGTKVSDPEVMEVLGVVDRKILLEAMKSLVEADRARLLAIVEQVHAFGYDLKEFCEELIRLSRDLLALKVSSDDPAARSPVDLPEEETRELRAYGEKLSFEEIHFIFRSLSDAYDEIARSNFPRIVLEMTLARIARKRPILSIEEVLARLQSMEERLLREPLPMAQKIETEEFPAAAPIPMEEDQGAASAPTPAEPPISTVEEPSIPTAGPKPERVNEEEWKEFLNFVKKKKPPLASLLGHGRPLAFHSDRLEIGYPKESFYLERMQEKDNLELLERLGREFFQRPVKVRISGIEPDSSSSLDGGPNREEGKMGRNNHRDAQEEALNHPLVQEAINIFGGRVIEIKTP
jgi:DNA polymerase-3 subunit gamma/tau